uniref:tautomerase family protein n=1 Tax=Cephaloticoccus sp. TaxID=1985742 RepID=UPI0040492A96
MPLIEIEIIGELTVPQAGLARNLADAMATVFGSDIAQTWVRLRMTPVFHYAENGTETPLGASAIFVKVTKRHLPDLTTLGIEADRISEKVSELCHRPKELVHVIYEPPGNGRIAFGGKLLK